MRQNENGVDHSISKDTTVILDALQQIVDILQTSTIAEERGNDPRSKFWATYKKVSGEFDDNMLERCNGNMDIALIFAGLFSAVNTAFIIAMQPNPLDTTNALLVQLIQITLQGASATTPAIQLVSTGYSSSNFWMQALAYMSLALSLLAAFGAVLGKQWLNYYKTHRFGSGSLEQRCLQRQRKYQGLETWQFEGVLKSPAHLLKVSLFLFGLSLGAIMWAQQKIISALIIATTTFGFIFYFVAKVASLVDLDCPCPAPLSPAIHVDPQDKDFTLDAIKWVTRASTNPDAIMAAINFILKIPGTVENVNFSQSYKKVLGMFEACFDATGNAILGDGALVYGSALIQITRNDPSVKDVHRPQKQNFWTSWRAIYLPHALEQCQNSFDRMKNAGNAELQLCYQADTRTALRMVVPACMDEFTGPDDQRLIWAGRFELELDRPKVEWLVTCVEKFLDTKDFEPAGDALLLLNGILKSSSFLSQDLITLCLNCTYDLSYPPYARFCNIALRAASRALSNNHSCPCHKSFSQAIIMAVCSAVDHPNTLQNDEDVQFNSAIKFLNFTKWPNGSHLESSPLHEIQLLVLRVLPAPNVDDPERYTDYCCALKHHIGSSPILRSTALRIASDLRQDLATISADGVGKGLRYIVLSQLFSNFLTANPPGHSDADSHFYHLRLLFYLASRSSWLQCFNEEGYIERYIGIIPDFCESPPPYVFYLATLFLRIQAAHPTHADPQLGTITSRRWRDLMMMAWCVTGGTQDECDALDDDTETLKALVAGTRLYMPLQDALKSELRSLHGWLSSTVKKLESREPQPDESIFAVKDLKDLVHHFMLETRETKNL